MRQIPIKPYYDPLQYSCNLFDYIANSIAEKEKRFKKNAQRKLKNNANKAMSTPVQKSYQKIL